YAWAAASMITLLLTLLGAFSGVLQRMGADLFEAFMRERTQMTPEALARIEFLLNARAFSGFLPLFLLMGLFGVFAVAALQIVFRTSWLKAALIVILTGAVLF